MMSFSDNDQAQSIFSLETLFHVHRSDSGTHASVLLLSILNKASSCTIDYIPGQYVTQGLVLATLACIGLLRKRTANTWAAKLAVIS